MFILNQNDPKARPVGAGLQSHHFLFFLRAILRALPLFERSEQAKFTLGYNKSKYEFLFFDCASLVVRSSQFQFLQPGG